MSNTTNIDLKDRIMEYETDIKKLGKRLELEPVVTLEFPQYSFLPEEVIVALKVLEGHGRKFMLSYKDLKESK